MPIRKMLESDIPQVLAIQEELQFQAWNEKQFLAEINASYAHCIVYADDSDTSKIVGYAIFHIMGPDSELLSIAVRENQGRKGYGTQLLLSGLSKLNFDAGDICFLEVREHNAKARAFYEKNGWVEFASRAHSYADGENAILYKVSHV